MDSAHRDFLRTNRSYIIDNMTDLSLLVDKLMQSNIMTENMMQEIMAEKTDVKQKRKFLDFLPKRGPSAFRLFCEALIQEKQHDLAFFLDPSLRSQYSVPVQSGSQPGVPTSVYPQPVQDLRGAGSHPTTSSFSTHSSSVPSPNISGNMSSPPVSYKPLSNAPLYSDWPGEYAHVINKEEVPTSPEALKKQLQLTNVYPVVKPKRGRVLLIKNRSFTNPAFKERIYTDTEAYAIMQVLKKLAFSVELKADVKLEDLEKMLAKEAVRDAPDIYILVILSYGGAGTVMCADGQEISIQSIVDKFSMKNCPGLAGKPKLLFIQACGTVMRDVEDAPKQESGGGDTGDSATKDIEMAMERLNLGLPKPANVTDTVPNSPTATSFNMDDTSDILVAMAISPDDTSGNFQTHFIMGLKHVLQKYSKDDHILELLNKVNRLKRDPTNPAVSVPLCQVKDSLSRFVYFMPGYCPAEHTTQENSADFMSLQKSKQKPL